MSSYRNRSKSKVDKDPASSPPAALPKPVQRMDSLSLLKRMSDQHKVDDGDPSSTVSPTKSSPSANLRTQLKKSKSSSGGLLHTRRDSITPMPELAIMHLPLSPDDSILSKSLDALVSSDSDSENPNPNPPPNPDTRSMPNSFGASPSRDRRRGLSSVPPLSSSVSTPPSLTRLTDSGTVTNHRLSGVDSSNSPPSSPDLFSMSPVMGGRIGESHLGRTSRARARNLKEGREGDDEATSSSGDDAHVKPARRDKEKERDKDRDRDKERERYEKVQTPPLGAHSAEAALPPHLREKLTVERDRDRESLQRLSRRTPSAGSANEAQASPSRVPPTTTSDDDLSLSASISPSLALAYAPPLRVLSGSSGDLMSSHSQSDFLAISSSIPISGRTTERERSGTVGATRIGAFTIPVLNLDMGNEVDKASPKKKKKVPKAWERSGIAELVDDMALRTMMLSRDTDILRLMLQSPEYTDELAQALCMYYEREGAGSLLIHWVVGQEVVRATRKKLMDATTFFREDTNISRLFTTYALYVGQEYLQETLRPVLSRAMQLKAGSYEIEPSKCNHQGHKLKDNVKRMRALVCSLLDALLGSLEVCPMQLRMLSHALVHQVSVLFRSSREGGGGSGKRRKESVGSEAEITGSESDSNNGILSGGSLNNTNSTKNSTSNTANNNDTNNNSNANSNNKDNNSFSKEGKDSNGKDGNANKESSSRDRDKDGKETYRTGDHSGGNSSGGSSTRYLFREPELVVVGGFFFLRFFCPAIVSPYSTGVLKPRAKGYMPNEKEKELERGLVLAAKVVQSLSNGLYFEGSNYMAEMNEVMAVYSEKMCQFLRTLPVEPHPARNQNTECSTEQLREVQTIIRTFMWKNNLFNEKAAGSSPRDMTVTNMSALSDKHSQ